MEDSKCAFNYAHLLFYKCHKINPNHGESYIDSQKKATKNSINK